MRTSWEQVLEGISQCEKCGLCKTRHSTVPGEGNVHARVLFVGEGPGADEDAQGRPFVGRAGQLLTQMILAIGLNLMGVTKIKVANYLPGILIAPVAVWVASLLSGLV